MIVVAGCGRSGTHWLAHVLGRVLGEDRVHFEPPNWRELDGVIVDSRLRKSPHALQSADRVVHLARDGRDVVRSLHAWYSARGRASFEACCNEWADAVAAMGSYRMVRLEDLLKPRDAASGHPLPPYDEWTDDQKATFWRICGDAMQRCGYR